MFARRTGWDLTPNELARRVAARRARGLRVIDLAESNPTRVGIAAGGEALAAALADLSRDSTAARYEPDPRGDEGARAAIAAYHARDAAIAPEQVVLCAGTSEGYAHLFRLLADPGERVHVPSPGYGLFEHLAALEGLEALRYPLRPPEVGARWRVDLAALRASLGARSRAVLVIHPHNPTGSFLDPEDLAALRALAREHGLALLSDEVFADYGWTQARPPGALAGAGEGPLSFVLSGASKVLGLPQLKLAWIAVAGPARARHEALARLEFVADAYLSVSPLLARTLPGLLARREALQAPIRARVAHNRAQLASALAGLASAQLLAGEAGWAAILRARGGAGGGPPDEETLALELLERDGVLVQPGFTFELEDERAAHFVVSLLPEPGDFAAGAAALVEALARGGR